MPQKVKSLLFQYLTEVQKIYGSHLKRVILYGSYARGDSMEKAFRLEAKNCNTQEVRL